MSITMLAISAMASILNGLPRSEAQAQPPTPPEATATRFESVDVYVDAGTTPLAAYQIRLNALTPDSPNAAVLVGIEGGEAGVFENPPYYDAKALSTNRIVVAAYSLGTLLPVGRTRVARLHVQLGASQVVRYECKLEVAGDALANSIPATAEAVPTGRRTDALKVPAPTPRPLQHTEGQRTEPSPETSEQK